MTVTVVVTLLLATLAAALVGTAVMANEADRKRAMLADVGRLPDSNPLVVLRNRVERSVLRSGRGTALQLVLLRASITRPVVDVIMAALGVLAAAVALGYVFGGPILSVLALVAAVGGMRAWLESRREKRREQFIDQLPELARLLANATQAGLSLRTALSVAAKETDDPVRGELRQVNREVALGAGMESVLERLAERLPSRELAVLVNVLVIQSRAGGQVVTALRGVTESLESRRDLRREVKALLAGSKATVVAIAGLAVLMVLIVQSQIDGGLEGLLAKPAGLVLVLVSAALFVVGLLLIRRMTRVEA